MSFLILELQNPANWQAVWEWDITATRPTPGTWNPIPEQTCPLILHSPVVGIFTQNELKKPHWVFGGILKQRISTGLVVGGNLTVQSQQIRDVYLDQLQVLTFNNLQVADYSLSFKPAFWHEHFKMVAWEYIGEITDTTREAIRGTNQLLVTGFTSNSTKLMQIEQKIDSIL